MEMKLSESLCILPFHLLNPEDEAAGRVASGLRSNILSALTRLPEVHICPERFDPALHQEFPGFIISSSISKSHNGLHLLMEVRQQQQTHDSLHFQSHQGSIQELEQEILTYLSQKVLNRSSKRLPILHSQQITDQAYETYLQARYFQQKFTPEDNERAIALFEKVLEENAAYSSALSGKARVWFQQIRYGTRSANGYAEIKQLCEQALEQNLENMEAHAALALVCMYAEKDFYAAGVAFQNALALEQDYTEILEEYSWFLLAIQQDKAALEAIDRALGYDPLSTYLICSKADLIRYTLDYEEALRWYQKAYDLDPFYGRSIEGIASCNALLDRKDTAFLYLDRYRQLEGAQHWRYRVEGEIASRFGNKGMYDKALAALKAYETAHLEAQLAADYISFYVYQDPDLAMEYMHQAYEGGVGLVSLMRYPIFLPLMERTDYQRLFHSLQQPLDLKKLGRDKRKILHIQSDLSESFTLHKAYFLYAEADGNYVRVFHLKHGKVKSVLLRMNLSGLQAQLDPGAFLRIHKSYLLHMDFPGFELKGNAKTAHMELEKYGVKLPVSRKVYREFR